jgi:hypothetical protein
MTDYLSSNLNFTLPEINPHSLSSPLLKQLTQMKNQTGVEATIQSCALVCLTEIACTFDLTLGVIKTTITIIHDACSFDFNRTTFATNFKEVYHLAFVTLGLIPKLILTRDLESLSTTFSKEDPRMLVIDKAAQDTIGSLSAQLSTLRVEMDNLPKLFKTRAYLDDYEDLIRLRKFPVDDQVELKKLTDELLVWTHSCILTQMKEKGLLEEADKQRLQHLHTFYSLLFPLKAILGSLPSDAQINFVIKHCNAHLESIEGIVSFATISGTESKKQCYKKIRDCFAFFYFLFTQQSDSIENTQINDLIKKLITHLLTLFNTHLTNHHATDLDQPKRFDLKTGTLTKSFGYPKQDCDNLALVIAHYEKLHEFCGELSALSDHIGIVRNAVQVMANSVAHELTQAREFQQAQATMVAAALP